MDDYFLRKTKKKSNKYFHKYYYGGKIVSYTKVKPYIQDIYIPPAYDNVKINKKKTGKIRAIGYDNKDRAQYIYNKSHKTKSCRNKFRKLIDFGTMYQKMIRKIRNDLYSIYNSKEKQIAMILMIIIDCNFRIGNEKYKDENNSHGVTTLEKKHIKIKNNRVIIDFIGKRGVQNTCEITNKYISNQLKKKKKSRNKHLFTYISDNTMKNITSSDVNTYLKQFGNFTTKNFRTWRANIQFIDILKKQKNIKETIKIVSNNLHHTASICKKNYIEPNLINFYKINPEQFLSYFQGNIDTKFRDFLQKIY